MARLTDGASIVLTTIGPQGPPGDPGPGVPPGGAAGEVPVKLSGEDFDIAWVALTIGVVAGLTAALAAKAPVDSPAFGGVPSAPTASQGTNTEQLATTAFAIAEIAARALLRSGGAMTGALVLAGDPTVALNPATKQYVDARTVAPQGRLTLTTALAVTTADVLAATTIYYTPYNGGRFVPIWNGTAFVVTDIGGELSLALDSASGHTGYHQADKIFDLFVISDSGTIRLATGPAWTSDIARGSGAGTSELERKNGLLTNKVTLAAARWGSASGNTVSVPANQATYVGSFRATANGQAEDSRKKRLLFNAYNWQPRELFVAEATDSWTYSVNAFRQANASTANQVEVLSGLGERMVHLAVRGAALNSTATARLAIVAIGIDSVLAKAADSVNGQSMCTSTLYAAASAFYDGVPGLGWHYFPWLELGNGAGADTITWSGDSGTVVIQTGLIGLCWS
jgi:hypothetical protein